MSIKAILNEAVGTINQKYGENSVVTAGEIASEFKKSSEAAGTPKESNFELITNISVPRNNGVCQVRNLKKEEIECKIASIKAGKGLTLFLYKTARTDVSILDEAFGRMNWQCEYKEIKGNMYCGISVFDNTKHQWVTKWDCGIESTYGDREKGEASDAFKRAGFKWGIGVELYTTPFIWIPSSKCNIVNGKCCDKFIVEKIAIEKKEIVGLAIRNASKNNQRVFVWTRGNIC